MSNLIRMMASLLLITAASSAHAEESQPPNVPRPPADDTKFLQAITACENLTGVTLPRPPEKPNDSQMAAIQDCQAKGVFPPHPQGPPPGSSNNTALNQ